MIDTGRTLASIAAAAEERLERKIVATAIRLAGRRRPEEPVKGKLFPQRHIARNAVGELAKPRIHGAVLLHGRELARPRACVASLRPITTPTGIPRDALLAILRRSLDIGRL